jgi:hypothetical protein
MANEFQSSDVAYAAISACDGFQETGGQFPRSNAYREAWKAATLGQFLQNKHYLSQWRLDLNGEADEDDDDESWYTVS